MRLRAAFVLCSLLTLSLSFGCDPKESSSETPATEITGKDEAAAKKEALLRASGIDPATVKGIDAPEKKANGVAPTKLGTPIQEAPSVDNKASKTSTEQPGKAPATIQILNEGAEPRKKLTYAFTKGTKLQFTMDMTITPKRSINGQPMPTMPGVVIGMKGTSVTTQVENGTATRLNTFQEFVPGAEGLPPVLVEQMKAQFATLAGTQLTEIVSPGGQVLDIQIPPASAQNPQVVALLQNLQDGMTNAYLPLPDQPVGAGAKWKAVNKVQAAGISVTQENEITLKNIQGDKLTVELAFKQSAKPQKVNAPELPPGANVELTGMTGGGTGTMTVDLKSLVTDSKVDLNMTVDTKISGPDQPEPVLSSTDTGMKIHLKVTK